MDGVCVVVGIAFRKKALHLKFAYFTSFNILVISIYHSLLAPFCLFGGTNVWCLQLLILFNVQRDIQFQIYSIRFSQGERDTPCAHCVHTVHLFYLDNLCDPIVLLGCCPLRCCVAELVPHFMLDTLRVALYMSSLGLLTEWPRIAT